MNAPKLRPAVLRPKHLKPSLARAQRLATDRAQLTHEQLADATGTDRPHVSRWGHMHEPHAPSVLHVAAGPRAWALELIRWQAAAHGAAVWGSELVSLPALEVTPPIVFWEKKEIAIDVFHHAVYVGATGLAYKLID